MGINKINIKPALSWALLNFSLSSIMLLTACDIFTGSSANPARPEAITYQISSLSTDQRGHNISIRWLNDFGQDLNIDIYHIRTSIFDNPNSQTPLELDGDFYTDYRGDGMWQNYTLSSQHFLNNYVDINIYGLDEARNVVVSLFPTDLSAVRAIYIEDQDTDGVADDIDNCPSVSNPSQANTMADDHGDACDPDHDNDLELNDTDNCPLIANADQRDSDNDGVGDACDDDADNDGIADTVDDCPNGDTNWISNPTTDNDGDGCRDDSAEDLDDDNDMIEDGTDLDDDGDGLIEIANVRSLDMMRRDLRGASLDGYNTGCGGGFHSNGNMINDCFGYELTADLDLRDLVGSNAYTENNNWERIGHCSIRILGAMSSFLPHRLCDPTQAASRFFSAIFEGNNHTISHLRMHIDNNTDSPGLSAGDAVLEPLAADPILLAASTHNTYAGVGLFGALAELSSIRNLNIADFNISHDPGVRLLAAGAIAGYGRNARIISSSVHRGNISGYGQLGAMLGSGQLARIRSSSVVIDNLMGDANHIGGIIGYGASALIESTSGVIGRVAGLESIGGFVGFGENAEIIASKGQVSSVLGLARQSNAGGMLGRGTAAQIINSNISVGRVSGQRVLGGLVGFGDSAVIDSSSAQVMMIDGERNIGGLLGMGRFARVSESSAQTTRILASGRNAGGLIGNGESTYVEHSSALAGNITARNAAGGLIGNSLSSIVRSSSADFDKLEGTTNVGGLLGWAESAQLESSYVLANNISGTSNIGGLVGRVETSITIEGSVSIVGEISSTGDDAAGVIGLGRNSQINGSIGAVRLILGADNLGGLVASDSSGMIANSISINRRISGDSDVHQLIGGSSVRPGAVTNSFWQDDVSAGNADFILSPSDPTLRGMAQPIDQLTASSASHFVAWSNDWCDPATGEFTNSPSRPSDSYVAAWNFGSDRDYPALECFGDKFTPEDQRLAIRMIFDSDNDGIVDISDNCPAVFNPDQANSIGLVDDVGDACDDDYDNDQIIDGMDNCPRAPNTPQADLDGDNQGDACDDDDDGDSINDLTAGGDLFDNCPLVANFDQADHDGDGQGDLCDADDDNDGIANADDSCRLGDLGWNSNPSMDSDDDGCRDATEDDDDDNDSVLDASDVDDDGDGLIEIADVQQLDMIRNNLAGSGLDADNSDGSTLSGGDSTGCGNGNTINFCNGYELIRDLNLNDLAGTAGYSLSNNWERIGSCTIFPLTGTVPLKDRICSRSQLFSEEFFGIFEGNNYKISNITMHISASSPNPAVSANTPVLHTDGSVLLEAIPAPTFAGVGFFGAMGSLGEIRNLHLDNITISQDEGVRVLAVGSSVGSAFGGSIDSSSARVDSLQGHSYIGGMVGLARGHEISDANLVIQNRLMGNNFVGGLVGGGSGMTIRDVRLLGSGNVSGVDAVAGLVGDAQDMSSITDTSVRLSSISGEDSVGGLFGKSQSIVVSDVSVILDNIEGNNSVGGLVGESEAAALVTRAAVEIGTIEGHDDVGGLAGELATNSIITEASVDLTSIEGRDNVGGLVGDLATSSAVTGASVQLASIEGRDNVGGLAGWTNNTRIIASSARAQEIAATRDNVGGLLGYGTSAYVVGSYAIVGDITGGAFNQGGLIGSGDEAQILVSMAIVNLISGRDYAGGLAGYGTQARVSSSAAIVDVIRGANLLGGLLGNGDRASITNSYSFNSHIDGYSSVHQLSGGTGAPQSLEDSFWQDNVVARLLPFLMDNGRGTAISLQDLTSTQGPATSWTRDWCDPDSGGYLSNVLSNSVPADYIPLWDFGTDTELPAINCFDNELTPAVQRMAITALLDADQDDILNSLDNCPRDANPQQYNNDTDPLGDACDLDDDGDGVTDVIDNCPIDANPQQHNNDTDALGDECDLDDDNDGISDLTSDGRPLDMCPRDGESEWDSNPTSDNDGDGCLDATEDDDDDNDNFVDSTDVDDDGDGLIEIANEEQLNMIRNNLAGTGLDVSNSDGDLGAGGDSSGCGNGISLSVCRGYELVRDLDLTKLIGISGYSAQNNWERIGFCTIGPLMGTTDLAARICNLAAGSSAHFTGIFEGNNYKIANISMHIENSMDNPAFNIGDEVVDTSLNNLVLLDASSHNTYAGIGFFGALGPKAIVRNLVLSNLTISHDQSVRTFAVGGLAGYAYNATISNLRTDGGDISAMDYAGGLVGMANSGMITNSHAKLSSILGANSLGGLLGMAHEAEVMGSSAILSRIEGASLVGGLVGDATQARVLSSSAVVNELFTNEGASVGGLVGLGADAQVHSSVAILGNISAAHSIGGLVGFGEAIDVQASMAVVRDILGNSAVGGLISNSTGASISNTWALNSRIGGNYHIHQFIGAQGVPDQLAASFWQNDVINLGNNFDLSFDLSRGLSTTRRGMGLSEADLKHPRGPDNRWRSDWCNPISGEHRFDLGSLAAPYVRAWDFGTANDYPALRCFSNGLSVDQQRQAITDVLNRRDPSIPFLD